jgi:hypothetical protein
MSAEAGRIDDRQMHDPWNGGYAGRIYWGKGGSGHISYADWLKNGSDVRIARLGVPVELAAREASTAAAFTTSARAKAYYDEICPHVISLRNDGQLRNNGNLATPPEYLCPLCCV